MPKLDATATTAVSSPGFAIAWFLYLDISGDPFRVTTAGQNITFASTGDADLDGFTFTAFGGQALSVSPVVNSEAGSDTVTVKLSGIVSVDTSLLNDIGNTALWQGRTARIWFAVYDVQGVTQQGAIVPHYTGYMTAVDFDDSPESQSISLSVENWLATFSQASNRTLLRQSDYDSADTSAAATIASANGTRQGASGGSSGGMGGATPGHTGRVMSY